MVETVDVMGLRTEEGRRSMERNETIGFLAVREVER